MLFVCSIGSSTCPSLIANGKRSHRVNRAVLAGLSSMPAGPAYHLMRDPATKDLAVTQSNHHWIGQRLVAAVLTYRKEKRNLAEPQQKKNAGIGQKPNPCPRRERYCLGTKSPTDQNRGRSRDAAHPQSKRLRGFPSPILRPNPATRCVTAYHRLDINSLANFNLLLVILPIAAIRTLPGKVFRNLLCPFYRGRRFT